jgi:hypothetical protein
MPQFALPDLLKGDYFKKYYESRKFIFNPKFAQSSSTAAPDIPSEVL